MVKEEKAHGSVKRFGARYGRKTKLKFSKVENEQRKLHKCPYCSKIAVKRVAMGIWQCRKCDIKFTGKAYSLTSLVLSKDAPEQKEIEVFQRREENAEDQAEQPEQAEEQPEQMEEMQEEQQ